MNSTATSKKDMQKLTNEISIKRKDKFNKLTIGAFILITCLALVIKLIDGALQDFGFGIDDLMIKATGGNWSGNSTFHQSFWLDKDIVEQAKNASNHTLGSMVMHHPNFLWLFTQFTWITTIIILMFLVFRLFKFEDTLPRWLWWIMRQRTLSLIVMYDMVVGIVFWSSMFSSFQDAFVPGLFGLELTMTILVHAIIPLLILAYSVIFLIRDEDASVLKETFVFKGMIYPLIYMAYYILVSQVWEDPYSITDLHNNFARDIWKMPVALVVTWILLGFMLLSHNLILFKMNKVYDPEQDKDILKLREQKIENIKRKVKRKYARSWRYSRDVNILRHIKKEKNKITSMAKTQISKLRRERETVSFRKRLSKKNKKLKDKSDTKNSD